MSRTTSSAAATLTALDGPALLPPTGAPSHLSNRSSQQNWYYVFISLCTIIPGVLLLLRLYTKIRIVRKLDLTDYTITSAYLFMIGLIAIGRKIIDEGGAVHQWNVQLKHLIKMQFYFYIGQILYAPTIFLVKTAILLQYLRLLAPTKTSNHLLYYSARIIIVTTAIYYTITTFVTIFACSPLEKIWNPLIERGRCLDNNMGVLITCVFNIVSDIVILLLPARSVWRLQIPLRKKVPIVSLFAIGVLACIANIMIIYYVTQLGGANADITYNAAWMGCWAYVEIALGIIVTCTLSMPKLIEARGKKIRLLFANLTRSFTSFGSLMRSTRRDTTKSDTLARGDTPLDEEVNSEADLTRDGGAHELAVYQVQGDWRDVPALPKGIQEGSKNHYRYTR